MPASSLPTLTTVGEIARQTGLPLHRVEYLLHARQIQPIGRAGNARVYDPEVVELVRSEAALIARGVPAR